MSIQELYAALVAANTAQDFDRARRIAGLIRRHPDYAGRGRRYVIATRRNSRPVL